VGIVEKSNVRVDVWDADTDLLLCRVLTLGCKESDPNVGPLMKVDLNDEAGVGDCELLIVEQNHTSDEMKCSRVVARKGVNVTECDVCFATLSAVWLSSKPSYGFVKGNPSRETQSVREMNHKLACFNDVNIQ
jgi:hypothetical protein